MIGRIVDALSLIRLRMYSLFQKYRARSATCWLSYTKKKKIVKNPKQEHLRNQSISKQSYKRNTRQKKIWLVQQLVKEKTKLCLVTRYIMDSYKKNKKKRYSMLVTKQVVRKSSAEKRNKKETNSCRMSRSHDAHDESTKRNSQNLEQCLTYSSAAWCYIELGTW